MALEIQKNETNNLNNQYLSLKEIINQVNLWLFFLKNKWKKILIVGVLGGLTGYLVAKFDKPTYKALLTFAMEEEKGGNTGLGGALGLASSFGIELGGGGGGAFASSNLSALMKSRLIIEKVLLDSININGKITTLAEYYIKINDYRKEWSKNSQLKNVTFLPGANRTKFTFKQDSLLKQFHKALTNKDFLDIIQKDKKVTILTIEVNSKDELFSKLFCEAVANETSQFYIQTKSKKARLNTDVLQKQVDSVRNELNQNITGVARESDNLYNLNPSLNIKGTGTKKIQINLTANSEVLKQLVVQLELSKITLRKETPLIQLIDLPILPLEKNKLSKLKSFIIGSFFSTFIFILIITLNSLIKNFLKAL